MSAALPPSQHSEESLNALAASHPGDDLVQMLLARREQSLNDASIRAQVHEEIVARMDTGVRVNQQLLSISGRLAEPKGDRAASQQAQPELDSPDESSAGRGDDHSVTDLLALAASDSSDGESADEARDESLALLDW